MFVKTALERLSKADRSEVERAGKTYHGNFYDLIRHKLKILKKRSQQLGATVRTRDLATYFGHHFEYHILQRAIVDRFEKNSPRRMASALSASARFGLLDRIAASLDEPDTWDCMHVHALLRALACLDLDAVNKCIDRWPGPARRGHKSVVLLCNGVNAVARQDMASLRGLERHLRTRKENRFFRGMYDCILGVLNSDPQKVASGINAMLEYNRRTDLHIWMPKLICIESHAFHYLCSRVSPVLVSAFDATRDFPWDTEYHAFLQESPAPSYTEVLDFNRINNVLGRWVAELPFDMDVNELLASIEPTR